VPDRERRSLRPATARERINARRRSQRAGTWRLFSIGLGAVALLLVVALAVGLRGAGRALDTVQQEDPRRRTPATNAAAIAGTVPPAATGVATSAPATQLPASAAPLNVQELPDPLRQPFSVLLVGVDKRDNPDDGARSDTLILVRVNPEARTASMLSIPRDSVTTIPNVGQAKINTAYSFGYSNAATLYGPGTDPDAAGQAVAAEAVEALLGVPVDYTAQVDFEGFARLVDSVGGVVVDVPAPILDAEYPTENYGVERIYIPQGLQVMDGNSALIYARTRHTSSDFDRSKRQQQVLRALLEQLRGRGLLGNAAVLPRWADLLAENVRTTLPLRDLPTMAGLARLASEMAPERVLQLTINPDDVALDAEDGTDLYWNPVDLAALVARWEAGPAPVVVAPTQPPADVETARRAVSTPDVSPAPSPIAPAEGAMVQVLNGVAVEGVAGRVTEYLRARGFAVGEPETVTSSYAHTTIIDYSGRPETRRALARMLGIAPQYVLDVPGPDAPPQGSNVDIVVVLGADYNPEWAE
jgi:polyisoprenyl-teichoic acid--peptidoglycan teichoic acid transferase